MKDMMFHENDNGTIKPSEWRVYSVGELTREIKFTLEETFPPLWVEGEISNFKRHSSGHLYFSLKEPDAQISCVMWRGKTQFLPFDPHDGMKVMVFGNLTVYERNGRYQINVHRLRPVGVGELQAAFEALKQRLLEEGLFNPEFKKSIPSFPTRIGLVTSPTGAAIQDIVSVIKRRFPTVQLILKPVQVQGIGASEEIADAIKCFNRYGRVDVLIIGRGGGSIEDLWAFNEEVVARAIFESKIPVISAVGHEIDFSISDFVADVRAPTPSAAAELVVKDRDEIFQTLGNWKARMFQSLQSRMQFDHERITGLSRSYGFRFPFNQIQEYRQGVDDCFHKLEVLLSKKVEESRVVVNQRLGQLDALNPLAVLERGYSITTRIRDNKVVKVSTEVRQSDRLRTRLARGTICSVVEGVEK